MKLVVLDGYLVTRTDLNFDNLRVFGDLRVYDETPAEEVVACIGDADAVFVNRTVIGKSVMEACPCLRYIGVTGTGYNMVDIEAAQGRGITVCNSPAYSTDAVAQMTFALLLEIAANTMFFSGYVHAGLWKSPTDAAVARTPLLELADKTMGIVGMGAIGRRTAAIAEAFGMRVLGCRRSDTLAEESLEHLLRESDVVSLHCPLSHETRGLINAARIAHMKDGAILLNTARGAVLDENAVADALDSGKLYAAGVDVLVHEPPTSGDRLAFHPRCVVTPHVAWAPKETRARMLDIVAQNVVCFLKGQPQNQICP